MDGVGDGNARAGAEANLGAAEFELGKRDIAIERFRSVLRLAGPAGWRDLVIAAIGGIAAATIDAAAEQSARLLGFAEAQCRQLGFELAAYEQRRHDASVSALTKRLTTEEFERHRQSGAAMTPDEAVNYALSLD